LEKYFKLLSEHMKMQAHLISEQFKSHPGENGRNKEVILSKVLCSVLPDRYSIGTGFIVASDGTKSGQNDIIIYDKFWSAPLFPEFASLIFPIEAVYGVIEVKSNLGSKELDEAVDRAKAIKKMPLRGARNGPNLNPGLNLITHSLFAYDGMQLPSIRAHLESKYKDVNLKERIDFIVILNKGIFYTGSYFDIVRYGQPGSQFRNNLSNEDIARLKTDNPSEIGGMELNQYTFFVWSLWMLSHLSHAANRVSNWIDYLPLDRGWGRPI
jgi:hypothetical protein